MHTMLEPNTAELSIAPPLHNMHDSIHTSVVAEAEDASYIHVDHGLKKSSLIQQDPLATSAELPTTAEEAVHLTEVAEKFHALFELPREDFVADFSAIMYTPVPVVGTLFVGKRHVCFHGKKLVAELTVCVWMSA